MENLFIIMICTGGFGLLLCLGVGIQKTGSKALEWCRRFRYRQDIKKSQNKAHLYYKSISIIANGVVAGGAVSDAVAAEAGAALFI